MKGNLEKQRPNISLSWTSYILYIMAGLGQSHGEVLVMMLLIYCRASAGPVFAKAEQCGGDQVSAVTPWT